MIKDMVVSSSTGSGCVEAEGKFVAISTVHVPLLNKIIFVSVQGIRWYG